MAIIVVVRLRLILFFLLLFSGRDRYIAYYICVLYIFFHRRPLFRRAHLIGRK